MTDQSLSNPFAVQSPEDISADLAHHLWVDVFTDFKKIRDVGHCMLNGPRGCGKSMMFRYLQPDCQCLARKVALSKLDFCAILISIKNQLNLTDLGRIEDRSEAFVLNEHFLTMFVAGRVFASLAKLPIRSTRTYVKALREALNCEFVLRLRNAGWPGSADFGTETEISIPAMLERAVAVCDSLYTEVVHYVRRLPLGDPKGATYSGPLCGYLEFLFPLLDKLRRLPFMPKGPIYLLMDDADNLNLPQTAVLNGWIATRTSGAVSIKVSTQLRYKTYRTASGTYIESPHDYSDVNVSDKYTSSQGTYLRRVEEIVKKRLAFVGIKKEPRDFFPPDHEQEEEIRRIGEETRQRFETEGKGYRPSDDVVRYARPTFMARLGGPRKAGSTYSYAGFDQLVDLSSGLIRFFLEPAALMYAEESAKSPDGQVTCIRPGIQDKVVSEAAERLMLVEFDKIFAEEQDRARVEGEEAGNMLLGKKHRLHNLIAVLGGVFRAKLISDDAERRVFSVALSGEPVRELVEFFEMGAQFGYFQKSAIGNKDGTGKTPLYILTRRLAPYFKLDPTSFAGYFFITSERLLKGIENPEAFLRKIKLKKSPAEMNEFLAEQEPTLFTHLEGKP